MTREDERWRRSRYRSAWEEDGSADVWCDEARMGMAPERVYACWGTDEWQACRWTLVLWILRGSLRQHEAFV